MANEFKVKKGLIVEGSGGTILDIQGSVGQLFSITDSLTGDLFAVSDISGIPILNVNSSGAVDIDGTLNLGDSDKIQLGASQDLQIFHNGSNSYIETSSTSTGDFFITARGTNHDLYLEAADNIYLRPQGNENGIIVVGNGAVQLYHDNSQKFVTTSTGVTVTGNIAATNFSGSSSGTNTGDQDLSSFITSQRAISSTPTDGATTTAISSDWAFDNVKTAVPANAVFTDTVNTFDGAYSSLSGTPTIPSGNAIIDWTTDQGTTNIHSGNYSNTQLSNAEVIGAIVASNSIEDEDQGTIRSNIGAGTSSLAIGTTSTTAMAGNTSLFDGAYSSLSGTPTIPSGNAIIDWTADQGNTNIHSGNYSNTQLSQEEVLGMLTAGANITIATDGEISATDTVYTHPTSAGNKHIPTGGAAGQFLRYSSSGTATWATPSYTTNTNTTYSAGTGLDLTSTTFSVEPDLRDGITHVGKDANNYIQFDSTNGRIDFYAGGVFVARMESDGDLHMKGDVIAYSDIFS